MRVTRTRATCVAAVACLASWTCGAPSRTPALAFALTTEFQEGVSPDAGWSGAADTTLREELPDANFGAGTVLRADGDQPSGTGMDQAILLRWDISLVPRDATVTDVTTTERYGRRHLCDVRDV